MSSRTGYVLQDVWDERDRQDEKFGPVQSMPNGTGDQYWIELRTYYQTIVDELAEHGDSRWLPILLEEVYEAAAETDEALLRAELVQVAAVAVKWIESLDAKAAT